MNALRFAEPVWLASIPLAMLLGAVIYFAKERAWRGAIAAFCAPRLREQNVRLSLLRERMRAFLGLMAVVLVFVALARPQAGVREIAIRAPGSATLLLLDVSRSMLASDVSPDRLTRAKLFAQDLLEQMRPQEVGLAVFAGEAALLVPPTREHDLVAEYLREANPNSVSMGGTNFENALHEAVAVLGSLPHKIKTVILLTDGEDLDGNTERISQIFKESGLRLNIAVFGTEKGSTIAVEDPRGGATDLVRDPAGRVVVSRARPQEMTRLAESLGGTLLVQPYLPDVPNTQSEQAAAVHTVAKEWFWLPAAGAFALTLLQLVLPSWSAGGAPRKQTISRASPHAISQ